MSKQQWGHGYHRGFNKGYAKAKREEETKRAFKENKHAHWVEITHYGSEGVEPKDRMLCGDVGGSCISGSGESICAGYRGENETGTHVICAEKPRAYKHDSV